MNGSPLSAAESWKVRDQILDDPLTGFLREPAGFNDHWRRTTRGGKIGPNFWTDAYLSSLCASTGYTLVTFDRALARQKHCEVLLLRG